MKVENNLLEGSISKTIYLVAAPTMITMFMQTAYNLIDAIWIGKLGFVALAAVAAANFFLWLIFSACSLVEIGVNSLIAKYYGAEDHLSVNKIGIYGLRYSIFSSFIISLVGLFFLDSSLINSLGLDSDVIAQMILFLAPIFVFLPCFGLMTTSTAIFRGIGDTKTPLIVLSSTLLLNAVLAPILIFGYHFQGYGISGGAFATIVSELIASFINIYLLKKRGILKKISGKFLDKKSIQDITKIGSPIAFNSIIFCVVYLFLTKIIAQFGTESVAAIGIGQRIESLAYCASVGFSMAATTLVGQNIGAKNELRAKDTAWKIIYYAGSAMMAVSIFILLFKENIAGVFTNDPKVISAAAGYLTAIGYTEVFLAFEIVMEGIFSGTGNTLPPTIIGLPINILRIPCAYFLASIFGIQGIWWTIGISTVLKGSLLLIWFKFSCSKGLIKKEKFKPEINDKLSVNLNK